MDKFKLLILSLLTVSAVYSQDLSKLTPEQLQMYQQYMANKTNSTASENAANVNVRNDVQARKLQKKDSLPVYNQEDEVSEYSEDKYMSRDKDKKVKLKVFGMYLFNNKKITFEPQLNIATPVNYVLGTLDELLVDITGLYEASYKLKVSPEGLIRIPNVGSVKVAGLTIESASRSIKNHIAKVYMGVTSGETKVTIALGNIRSIRVTVIGEAVHPGTYTLPSLATVFNALYACGGPNEMGSMREVKVIRADKVIAKLDLYRFLVDGILQNNVVLQDEDVIKIDPYKARVTVNGAVKHPAIFEALPGETLQKIFTYAGGYADNAYKDKATIFRLNGKEKSVVDVLENQLASVQVATGDSVVVTTILNRYNNRVDIKGAVFRPGAYEFEPGLTLRKLIAKADGVKEDAYLNMAYITRKQSNLVPEVIGFNLGKVLKGDEPDLLLQKDDSVFVKSLFDLKEKEEVSISGAVKSPGKYPFVENLTVKDLIFKAKGFTEMALTDSIELVRPVKQRDSLLLTNRKSMVFKISMDKDFNFKEGSGNMLMKNGDQLIIRTISGYEGVRMVRVEGEVTHPGSYNITSKAEKISDVVKRAGGFTKYAYPVGAFLIRTENLNETEDKLNRIMQANLKDQLETQKNRSLDATMLKQSGANTVQGYTAMDSIQKKLSGSDVVTKVISNEGVVGLNLDEIMKHPGSKYDLKLEESDIIYIPRELQTVKVVGKVLFPTMVRFEKNERLRYYIENAGGFALNADKYKVFVLYPNGAAKSTSSFLGIKKYPKVTAGSRIVVPETPVEIKNKLTPAETVAILTSITTAVSLMYSILKAK